MRGPDLHQSDMFSYLSPEERVPEDHPLRAIRRMTDAILQELSGEFEKMYSPMGRPSIAPEKILRALLLQVFYTVRSERLLMEQLNYNLLFRWFVGLNMDDEVWVPTVFTKNRERLIEAEISGVFFAKVLEQALGAGSGFRRALHRRWHTAGGVGEPEKLQKGGRVGETGAPGRSGESERGLSW